METNETVRSVYELFDGLETEDRVRLAEGLFTANLAGETVLDPGSRALRFFELSCGERFIWMPSPEDGKGNGGLSAKNILLKKIKTISSPFKLELNEYFNTVRIDNNETITVTPNAWVLRVG